VGEGGRGERGWQGGGAQFPLRAWETLLRTNGFYWWNLRKNVCTTQCKWVAKVLQYTFLYKWLC